MEVSTERRAREPAEAGLQASGNDRGRARRQRPAANQRQQAGGAPTTKERDFLFLFTRGCD